LRSTQRPTRIGESNFMTAIETTKARKKDRLKGPRNRPPQT
jgi:hypothetical protein